MGDSKYRTPIYSDLFSNLKTAVKSSRDYEPLASETIGPRARSRSRSVDRSATAEKDSTRAPAAGRGLSQLLTPATAQRRRSKPRSAPPSQGKKALRFFPPCVSVSSPRVLKSTRPSPLADRASPPLLKIGFN